MKELDEITGAIIDASLQIHRDWGPGLLESAYEEMLIHLLRKRGFRVERGTAIRFEYEGKVFKTGLRADLVVEDQVVVELKSVEKSALVHKKKLLTYLRLSKKQVGLFINFGMATLREGLF